MGWNITEETKAHSKYLLVSCANQARGRFVNEVTYYIGNFPDLLKGF